MSYYFEAAPLGEVISLGSYCFTADYIKSYASRFDPLPFHLDEDEANNGPFGALAASGWQVAATWTHCFIHHVDKLAQERRGKGLPVAKLGPSPGLDDMKWLKPVLADDTVFYSLEFTEKIRSRSRPEWGILKMVCRGHNQHEALVFQFGGIIFAERQSKI